MKKILFILALVVSSIVNSQQFKIVGSWIGKPEGIPIEMIVNIKVIENELIGSLDIPKQSAKGIKLDEFFIKEDSIFFQVQTIGFSYKGEIKNDSVFGYFFQNGMSFKLNFSQLKREYRAAQKYQTPQKPYPYYTEEVTFLNKRDNIKLSGTISLPKKNGHFPMVVMISGSGPQDRDSEVFEHKLFLVAADYLTRNGIGVLRYDDRGVGESGGIRKGATSMDYSYDAEAAVDFLKEQKYSKYIGLYGHSEGGLIAPIVASRNNNIDFLVLVAAPGLRGDKLMYKQIEMVGLASGATQKEVNDNLKGIKILYNSVVKGRRVDSKRNKRKLTRLFKDKGSKQEIKLIIDKEIKSIKENIWFQYFLKTDPKEFLNEVTVPVIALNGDKDQQVYCDDNLKGIKTGLTYQSLKKIKDKTGRGIRAKENKDVTIIKLKNHNHLMQHSTTGNVNEYGSIEETLSEEAINEVIKWIQTRFL